MNKPAPHLLREPPQGGAVSGLAKPVPKRPLGGKPFAKGSGHLGFTMMSMLFILVVLAALGTGLAALSQRQQLGSASEMATAKAYQAAFAGLEWGSYQILRAGGQPACFASKSFVLPDQLADFTVTVGCVRTPGAGTVSDGAQALAFYSLTATACNIASAGSCPNAASAEPTYVERQLVRTLSK